MWVMINPQRRHLKVRKSAESQRVLDALYSYVEDNTNGPMKWLCSFWQDQQDSFGYEEIKQIVLDEVGPQSVFDRWFEDYSNFIREKMTPLWRQGIAAGAYSHPKIQELQAAGFTVTTSSANVNNWLLNRTGELVTNCTNTQIESLRYIIAEARSKGLSSDETARYIRPTIGLTRQQAGANMKLYESTKEQLRTNHPRMTEASIERKAREIAAKDAAKKQRTRAVTIARTENAYAYNYGNDEAIKQAEAAGLMPHMVPYWSTSHSGNVCPVCEELEGMPIDEGTGEFSVSWHNRDYTCELPPMHPRCMCAVEYREETEEESGGHTSQQASYEGLEDEWANLGEDAEIIDVNPDEHGDNCVNSVIAYEMRCRGKAVIAGPGMDDLKTDAFAGWVNPEILSVNPKEGAFEYIDSALGLWGDGARAEVAILRPPKFEGAPLSGHAFIAERRAGSASYIDTQNGVSYNVDEVRAMLEKSFSIQFCRIDKLDISDIGFKACKEVK